MRVHGSQGRFGLGVFEVEELKSMNGKAGDARGVFNGKVGVTHTANTRDLWSYWALGRLVSWLRNMIIVDKYYGELSLFATDTPSSALAQIHPAGHCSPEDVLLGVGRALQTGVQTSQSTSLKD